jgi:hypothetical protein
MRGQYSSGFGGTGPSRYRLVLIIIDGVDTSHPHADVCWVALDDDGPPGVGDTYSYRGDASGFYSGIYYGPWVDYAGTWAQFDAKSFYITTGNQSLCSVESVVHVYVEVTYSDTITSSPASGVLSDVSINSNTVAETVVGSLVSADVDGFQDDGSGTYTGTPNALIERPDHILKHVLINRCGKTAADIDSTSYIASGVNYATDGYELASVIFEKPDVRDLIYELATQSRSLEFWEGGTHHLIYAPTETVDKVIDSRIDLDSVSVRFVNRKSIKNKMSATYDKWWSGKNDLEASQKIVIATSADSVAKYGTLETDSLSFAYITDGAQAQDVINWFVANQKDIVMLLSFAGGPHLMELEKGDVVSFDITTGDQLDLAFLGLISSVGIFRVLDIAYANDEKETVNLMLETGTGGLTSAFSVIGFNPLGGIYHAAQSVTLTSAIVDTVIYYTTDGTDPDVTKTLYTGPIAVTQNTTIKARAYRNV